MSWPTPPLGSLVETIVPARDKPEELEGPTPWIRIEDFEGKYLSDSKSGQGVTQETIRSVPLRVFPTGTVVCSCSCTMGTTAIVTRPLVTNQTFIGLVPRGEGVTSEFLYYALQGHRERLTATATGAIQSYLSRDDFRALRIPIPDPDTQRAIAGFLDRETVRIDALVAAKERLLTLLRERLVAARRSCLVQDLASSGGIPLRRLVTCLDGRRVPLNSEERAERPGPYPYWGAGSIVDHIDSYLFDEDLVLLGEDGAPFFDEMRDVAFTTTGKVWVNNHIHVLRCNEKADPRWLRHMLNAVEFSAYITGSTRDKLTQEEMMEIRLPLLGIQDQESARNMLDVIETKISQASEAILAQIELLDEHRRTLITAAVTGQIEIPEAA